MGSKMRLLKYLYIILITLGIVYADITFEEAVSISKIYINSSSPEEREVLADILNTYSGDIADVINKIKPGGWSVMPLGLSPSNNFTIPKYLAQFPDDLLHYNVPAHYTTNESYGLFISFFYEGHS